MRTLIAALVLGVALPSSMRAEVGSGPAIVGAAELGKLDFPVSARLPAARDHFVRGVLALHSFFYDEALDEFRAATRLEPGFAMGYWGEAMACNETIWEWQDMECGRKAIGRVTGLDTLMPKEQALLGAVKLLYGSGTRPQRAAVYASEMERFYARWADDDEVAAFTALALLGTMQPGDSAVATRMRSGAIALEVLARNPQHPGAAHYVIHSFDDPIHAILALPAARRYARIAPEAFHARHMPAHIFVQLGRWDDAVASCESAWAASKAWIARRNHPLAKADYHSLNWLVSLYLQQERPGKAAEILTTFREAIAKENGTSMRQGYAAALLPYLLETRAWEKAEFYLAPLAAPATLTAAQRAVACHPSSGNAPAGVTEQLTVLTVRAHVAAARGNEAALVGVRAELAKVNHRLDALPLGKFVTGELQMHEASTQALLALARHEPEKAAREFLKAAAFDDQLGGNSFAEPGIIPWEEEAGLAWLQAQRPELAEKAFAAALAKRPGRARSLRGAAQAAKLRPAPLGSARLFDRAAGG